MAGSVMDCAFYIVALVLAAEYALLLVVMMTYLHRLISVFAWRLHKTEKAFLILAACNALGTVH
jgi:hypothetical protein